MFDDAERTYFDDSYLLLYEFTSSINTFQPLRGLESTLPWVEMLQTQLPSFRRNPLRKAIHLKGSSIMSMA